MQQITTELLEQIKSIVGAEYVFTDEESFEKYGRDETERLHYYPAVVVKPRKTEEIAALMQLANKHLIPVTPRGAGTGLTGGALPHLGGLVIAMERFNQILDIDERNLQVTTEPGVITEVLQNTVKEKGLFYPPDPASKGSCFIGGNISENSGGPKAVKYGVVKDYVLNLEIVLPTGEIIWTGSNVLKNATGYNLTQLIVGSEGTLGIVTKIVLRLIPHPKFDLLMLAPFDSLEKASEAVSAIFRAGITPSAMELMEIESIRLASKLCESTAITITDNLAAVVSYGHAGDGNLHIRINHPLYKKSYENEVIQGILIKIFELVKSLGGTISGEHGIGLIQKSFMPVVFDPVTMELMKGIKKVFDPNHILNAGKIFDLKK